MTCRKIDCALSLDESALLPAGLTLAATAYLPEDMSRNTVLFLFPGGGYSRGYFDIDYHAGDYSQAAYHARNGLAVIAIDHIGTGQSSLAAGAEPDVALRPEQITLEIMAAACDAAVRAALRGLQDGSLGGTPLASRPQVIGAGQSMGGCVITIAQALFGTFDGIALLGSSTTQTRLALQPGRRYPLRNCSPAELMEAVMRDSDMTACFHWEETPADLLAADGDTASPWRSRAVPSCAGELMYPGMITGHAARVRVPVLVGHGEIDVTQDPLADIGVFRSSCDVSLLIVPRMAHMHNFAPTRKMLWERLELFVRQVALWSDT